jgi:uncharacterized membrane protein YdjX (TVP38/TMEM64 family)
MRWTLLVVALLAIIIVPFVFFEDDLNILAARLARGEGASWLSAVIVFLLLASDVFLPIPSTIVSAAAGALLGFWIGTFVVWAGMSAACAIGYAFGARASMAARRFVGADAIARAERLAGRYGDYGLVLCRPVPVLAEASVILAGVVGAPRRRFLTLTSASNLGIAMVYAAVGAFAMEVQSFLLAFAAALVVPALTMLIARRWKVVPGPEGPGLHRKS